MAFAFLSSFQDVPGRGFSRRMRNRVKHGCGLLALLGAATLGSLDAQIIELDHFADMTKYVDADTLVLLDIDDTILVPKQMLGSDEWFCAQLQRNRETTSSREEALEQTLAQWEAIRMITKMELVEPGTNDVIAMLQHRGHCVMGLTTQGFTLATRTSRQLAREGIFFTKTAPTREEHYLQLNGHGVLFRNGILFTSGTSKGESLFRWLDQVGITPQRILFVNDKESHLRDVERGAEKHHVPFVGLRYAYSDARKRAFSMEIADYQLLYSTFNYLMSDEEAVAGLSVRQIAQ